MYSRRVVLAVAAVALGLTPWGYVECQQTGKPTPPTSPKPTESNMVYFSAHGKTYHKTEDCFRLRLASQVFTATKDQAEAHGLKPCHVCYRTSQPKTPAAPDWAKPVEVK